MTQAITAVGTRIYLGPSVDSTGDYILIGELGSMTPVGREWDVNDVTSFTSPTKTKEKIKGLLNPGQYNLVGNRIFDDASQAALKVAFDDPRPYWFQVVFPVNPYTGGGEMWTFAALVLSIDPPKIAPNRAIQFFVKLQATGARQTSTGYVNATGVATKVRSTGLGSRNWGAIWGNFSLPPLRTLPSDAGIIAIYPVIIASAIHDFCLQFLMYGSVGEGGLGGGLSGTQFTVPFNTGFISPEASFASTQFTDISIGTSLSVLVGQQIGFAIDSSLFTGGFEEMTVTGVGYAIYYRSGSPKIDPLMPPPFAVPAGQGVAWALPFSVALLGDGGTEGTSVATVATLNSI
jgi:hypothetical protein